MDAPNYVPGLYTVAQRDEIFTKAAKYPDAADGLQNQVPTIFPDGTVGWRQIPEGGDGTANANIAVVESTGYASKDYKLNDLLIYNDQLYIVRRPISSGQQIDLLTDVRSTRVDSQLFPRIGKGINLLRNWYFRGGGSQQGGGQLPINQRGLTTYTGEGPTIDGWQQTGGTTAVDAYTVTHTSPAGSSSDFYQIVDFPINDGFYNIPIIFGIMRQGNYFRASAVVYGTSEPVQVFDQPEFSLWLEALSDKRVKAIIRVYAGQSVSLQAAKLELGTHGTLAELAYSGFQISDPPPDYGEELAKCQRYYYRRHYSNAETIGAGVAVGAWGSVLLQICVGQQMASAYPSCKITGTVGLSPSVTISGSVPATPPASLSGTTANITFPATVTTEGAFYAYAFDANGCDIEFSVDELATSGEGDE